MFLCSELESAVDQLCQSFDKAAESIRVIADEVDALRKRLLVTRVSTASVGIASGVGAVAAGIAAFFTFGAMIPIAIALGSVSAASSVAGLAAQGITHLMESSKMKDAKAAANEAVEKQQLLLELADREAQRGRWNVEVDHKMGNTFEILNIEPKQPDSQSISKAAAAVAVYKGAITAGGVGGRVVTSVLSETGGAAAIGRQAASAAGNAGRVLAIGGKVLGAVGVVVRHELRLGYVDELNTNGMQWKIPPKRP